MEEKKNFDKENNNAHPQQQQQQQNKLTRAVDNDQYQKSKSAPPPPYQAMQQHSIERKKETSDVNDKNKNQQSEPLHPWRPDPLPRHQSGRPATLLIVPKYYEDKQNNNNNLENQSTFRDTVLLNTQNKRASNYDYGCLYSADAAQFNIKRDYDNNFNRSNNYFSFNNNGKEKKNVINPSIDTLNTAYTYHGTSCAESMITIGGVTLNQGSHSFDLESNFSRMVLGSHGTSSTLSALNKKPTKRDLLNLANFIHLPRSDGHQQQPIRNSNNIWFEETEKQEKPKPMPAKKLEFKKQNAKKSKDKDKKPKRLGPPIQARHQASRQMDDPMANRPRTTRTTDKSKKEKKNEFLLKSAAANEKY